MEVLGDVEGWLLGASEKEGMEVGTAVMEGEAEVEGAAEVDGALLGTAEHCCSPLL